MRCFTFTRLSDNHKDMKTMHFDSEVAVIVGVEAATLYQNIAYWCAHNRANNKHFHDGRYWTYNSSRAFSELFPFWKQRKIDRLIEILEKHNYISVGNYNEHQYDKTRWFADLKPAPPKIRQNMEMDFHASENGIAGCDEAIPDNKPDVKPNQKKDPVFEILISAFDSEEYRQTATELIEHRKSIKSQITPLGAKKMVRLFQAWGEKCTITSINNTIMNGWVGVFPSKEEVGKAPKESKIDLRAIIPDYRSDKGPETYSALLSRGWGNCSEEELSWAFKYQRSGGRVDTFDESERLVYPNQPMTYKDINDIERRTERPSERKQIYIATPTR